MKVKRYTAPDMRKALIMVRDELGPDAVILSNRKVPGGIEITVAKEQELNQAAEQQTPAKTSAVSENFAEQLRHASEQAAANPSHNAQSSYLAQKLAEEAQGSQSGSLPANVQANKEIARLNLEMDNLRKELQQQMQRNQKLEELRIQFHREQEQWQHEQSRIEREQAHQLRDAEGMDFLRGEVTLLKDMLLQRLDGSDWEQFSMREPVRASLFRRLRMLGLSPALARRIVEQESLPKEMRTAWRHALAQLSRQLPIYHSSRPKDRPRIVALVGPTGSGKTTTIAKIASQYVLDHGSEGLGIITTDSYRIGAHEQLRVLGKILEVPIKVASGKASLEQMIRQLQHKDLILIDTAGIRIGNPEWQEQVEQMNQLSYPLECFLMLPCTQQHRVLESTVKEYKALRLSGCILSKLDETQSLGESLSVVVENRLPLAYVTNGQNIPQDIHEPKAHTLVSKAVTLISDTEQDPHMVPHEFAGAGHNNDYAQTA